jgi:hypothetical protein
MTEEFIIHLLPAAKLSALRSECRRGHPFTEGSFRLKPVRVKGKLYTVRDCIACNRLRQSQYQIRKREKKKFQEGRK